MSAGFGGVPNEGRVGKDAKITVDFDEIAKLTKKYKKLKKYMKSLMFELKQMYGTEEIISKLLKELEENPEQF
jgi:hypothetical protein